MTFEKAPHPCLHFQSHAICFLVCAHCWHDWDAHVKALAEKKG